VRRISRVFLVLLSILCLSVPAHAQSREGGPPSGQQASGFQLGQNYPNPFNPETKIPFTLGEELFADGQPVVVSMRIYNLLQQLVASPTPLRHPAGEGVPLMGLEYTRPGDYEALWDGTDRTGSEVASGFYFLQLTVNGRSRIMKMTVAK
jgi:hypothetical protein